MRVEFFLRRYFATAAVRERDARVKHYPTMVSDGKITAEAAEAEISAWRAIAELLEAGSAPTSLSWAELEHATANALLRREEALAAQPGAEGLIARRDAVWGIHQRIAAHRAALMQQPSPRKEAA